MTVDETLEKARRALELDDEPEPFGESARFCRMQTQAERAVALARAVLEMHEELTRLRAVEQAAREFPQYEKGFGLCPVCDDKVAECDCLALSFRKALAALDGKERGDG